MRRATPICRQLQRPLPHQPDLIVEMGIDGLMRSPTSCVVSCISSRIFPAFSIPAVYRCDVRLGTDPDFAGSGLEGSRLQHRQSLCPNPLRHQGATSQQSRR
jgi:hypothetical protein